MNQLRYVTRSLFFFWRVNLAVGLGVIAATAVLTGALLIGDSMRGSLKKISMDGLGKIDEILITDRFFREDLATELSQGSEFKSKFPLTQPIVLFPNASATFKISEDEKNVANKVTLIGCKNTFWKFASEEAQPKEINPTSKGGTVDFESFDPSATTVPIVLNQPLADDLGISIEKIKSEDGVILTVQIPKPQLINADNPIGKKDDLYETIARLKVASIIPAKSIGRFTLHPTQLLPRILFLPIGTVQEALQKEGFANAIIVSAKDSTNGTTLAQSEFLQSKLQPTAEDLGLIFKEVEQSYKDSSGNEETVFQYTSLSSDQLLFTDSVSAIAEKAFADYRPQPLLTYLANGISIDGSDSETIPFSMVTGANWTEDFRLTSSITNEPIRDLEDDEIVINSWSADDFLTRKHEPWSDEQSRINSYKSLIGKELVVSYFEPEASHGKLIPRESKFKLVDIAEITTPKTPFNRRRIATFDQSPTLANDPDLTPFVPGLTDQNSVSKWDLPFKTNVGPRGDDYWQFYRTTPKAFINLKIGQELWQSRFGKVTSYRINSTNQGNGSLADKFVAAASESGETLGFQFTPIKRRNLEASSGSTPFDVLFLALSFFIIASALILIALLFRLGVEQKSSQLGLLASVGLNRSQVSFVLLIEGTIVSILGAAMGTFVGIGYAQLMVYGLTTWWVGAVMTSFMEYHWTVRSLAIGFFVGVLVSQATIWFTVRRLGNLSIRDLLSGKSEAPTVKSENPRRWISITIVSCFFVAIALSIVAATSLGGEAQAGAFMGGGFLMLTALLLKTWKTFKKPREQFAGLSGNQLALQNAGRNPLRSTLTIGLVASATFLIVAVSAFHLSPSEKGTGGFAYIAESSRPIIGDFNDEQTKRDLLGENYEDLKDVDVFSIRYLPGDEAGCNNPFQAQRPKVLGVTDAFIERFDDKDAISFEWGGSTANSKTEKQNPWELLKTQTDDGTIPVVIDKNTAMYSLKIWKNNPWGFLKTNGVGGTYDVEFDGGQKVTFRIVGLVSNSILQGSLIIDEDNFVKLFPNISGYRTFLLSEKYESSKTESAAKISKFENQLSLYGFDASDSVTVLSGFLAVQNTYLSTFQTLGAFGLLLGTFGLATVQLRNVVERRKEFAVMQAIGFSKSNLGSIVLAEHSVLLLTGMLIGFIAALFSVVPHILFGEAEVPILMLAIVLVSILFIGLLSGFSAVLSSIRTPILSALRSDT